MQLIRFFEISEMNDHARHTAVRADKNNGALQHGVATSVRKAWATPKVIVGALVDVPRSAAEQALTAIRMPAPMRLE
jgi:hypothetical protein